MEKQGIWWLITSLVVYEDIDLLSNIQQIATYTLTILLSTKRTWSKVNSDYGRDLLTYLDNMKIELRKRNRIARIWYVITHKHKYKIRWIDVWRMLPILLKK